MSIPLSALMPRRPVDPDLDLVSLNVRVPRHLVQALDATAFLWNEPKQRIVADVLRGVRRLPQQLVDEARRAAGG